MALEVQNLSVFAQGGSILRNISFSLNAGEKLLIVGRSGSGKTTLLRAIAGIAQHIFNLRVSGHVRIYGERIDLYTASRHIYYVPQEPWYSLYTPYPVLETLSYAEQLNDVEPLARKLGIYNKLVAPSTELSAGEAQRINILHAILSRSSIVLIDEATSYLDQESKIEVVKALKTLSEQGTAIIVVDHDLRLWRGFVDKVLYIEDGGTKLYDDPLETPIAQDLENLNKRLAEIGEKGRGGSCQDTVAVAENIWFKYPDAEDYIIKGASLNVCAGELVWVKGSSGKGKSTLLKILAGILKPSRGSVRRFTRSVQLIPENPLQYISSPTVAEELNYREDIAILANLQHRFNSPITFLSSGERRRLAIASAFIRSPRLLLIDEPTVGLDPWNAISILTLLLKLLEKGSSIVVASHGEELSYIASRIVEVR